MSDREHLRGLAHRGPGFDVGLTTLWLARALWECWPPRKQPRPLLLLRRPDASAERWALVHAKLDAAAHELRELADVTVQIEWHRDRGVVTVATAGQMSLDGQLGWEAST